MSCLATTVWPVPAKPVLPRSGLRRWAWPLLALLTPVACAEAPRAGGSAQAATSAPAVAADAASRISRIVLEQGCFGCAHGSVLVLQRDGQATLTLTGNARHGTRDQVHSGTVGTADFDALARLAIERGFFAEPPTHDDPQLRDGAWTVLRLTRDGQDQQVFRRESVEAPDVLALEAAVKAVQGRITFAGSR